MKIVLCDDNELVLAENAKHLQQYISQQDITATIHAFSKVEELFDYARKNYIDIAILDIEMGDENGIEVAKKLNNTQPNCQVIYLTSYLEYATEVYDTKHNCYVLKGQFTDRIDEVMKRVIKAQEVEEKKIIIPCGKNTCIIPEKNIIFVERDQRYTVIHTDDGEEYKTKEKLDDVEKLLDETRFMRCHNSYVVSMMHIKQYSRTALLLDNDMDISISRQYISQSRERFLVWCNQQG